jgi:uncharacterized protein YaaW (UPF0174 family)
MSEIPLREPDDDLLPLLRGCDSDELEALVAYITNKGLGRISSQLEITEVYKKYQPNHQKYVDEIAAEIQKFGGNTFINQGVRKGKGVPYKEIVCDVADRLKVNYNKARDVGFIEMQILFKVCEEAWENMSDEEKMQFMDEIGGKAKSGPIPKEFPLLALQAAIKAAGFKAFPIGLKIALNVANAVSKVILGKSMSLNIAKQVAKYTTQSMKFLAGPIGWAITSILTLFDLASSAYRVTVPCVLHIAMLRQLHEMKKQE